MAPGPLLERRETRLTDGSPVMRLMLFEQAVAHQKRDAALAYFDRRDHDHAFSAASAQPSCTNSGCRFMGDVTS